MSKILAEVFANAFSLKKCIGKNIIKMINNINNTLFIILLLLASLFDLKYRRVPNNLLLSILILAAIMNIFANGFVGLSKGIIGFFLGIVLLIIPFAMGGIGAGDVKLLAVIGFIKGGDFVFHTFLSMAIWGGAISIVILLYHNKLLHILIWLGSLLKNLILTIILKGTHIFIFEPLPETKLSMPYAVPISLGAATIMLLGGRL